MGTFYFLKYSWTRNLKKVFNQSRSSDRLVNKAVGASNPSFGWIFLKIMERLVDMIVTILELKYVI